MEEFETFWKWFYIKTVNERLAKLCLNAILESVTQNYYVLSSDSFWWEILLTNIVKFCLKLRFLENSLFPHQKIRVRGVRWLKIWQIESASPTFSSKISPKFLQNSPHYPTQLQFLQTIWFPIIWRDKLRTKIGSIAIFGYLVHHFLFGFLKSSIKLILLHFILFFFFVFHFVVL